ncbi:hypothetical protein NQZ68_038827 [Dissostichus eleginoides]|nr:hypothetical protein NQZ68_038827 [Dissostichus eleginoides]
MAHAATLTQVCTLAAPRGPAQSKLLRLCAARSGARTNLSFTPHPHHIQDKHPFPA